jgi:hypothetical protein
MRGTVMPDFLFVPVVGGVLGAFLVLLVIGFYEIAKDYHHIYRGWKHRKKMKEYVEFDATLTNRLYDQKKTQLRMIKERDAADSNLFDKVEEYRRDFDERS